MSADEAKTSEGEVSTDKTRCLIEKLDVDCLTVVCEFISFNQRFDSLWRVSKIFALAHSRAPVHTDDLPKVVGKIQTSIEFCCVSDIIYMLRKHHIRPTDISLCVAVPRLYYAFATKEESLMYLISPHLRKLMIAITGHQFAPRRTRPTIVAPAKHSPGEDTLQSRWIDLIEKYAFPRLSCFGFHAQHLDFFVPWLARQTQFRELIVYGELDRVSKLAFLKHIDKLEIGTCHMVIADEHELTADFTHLKSAKVNVDEYSSIPVCLFHDKLEVMHLSLNSIIAPVLDVPLRFSNLRKFSFEDKAYYGSKKSTFGTDESKHSSSVDDTSVKVDGMGYRTRRDPTRVRCLDEEFDLRRNLIIEKPWLIEECVLESVTYNQALCMPSLCPNGEGFIRINEPMKSGIRAHKWIEQFKQKYQNQVLDERSDEKISGMKSLTIQFFQFISYGDCFSEVEVWMTFLHFIYERMIPVMKIRLWISAWKQINVSFPKSKENTPENSELLLKLTVDRKEQPKGVYRPRGIVDLYFE